MGISSNPKVRIMAKVANAQRPWCSRYPLAKSWFLSSASILTGNESLWPMAVDWNYMPRNVHTYVNKVLTYSLSFTRLSDTIHCLLLSRRDKTRPKAIVSAIVFLLWTSLYYENCYILSISPDIIKWRRRLVILPVMRHICKRQFSFTRSRNHALFYTGNEIVQIL